MDVFFTVNVINERNNELQLCISGDYDAIDYVFL